MSDQCISGGRSLRVVSTLRASEYGVVGVDWLELVDGGESAPSLAAERVVLDDIAEFL